MMSSTHIAYAKQINEHIYLKYGIKLKHYSFIYGSIKPDASILYSGKTKHYFNESLDLVIGIVNILIESIDSPKELATRAFARELGVIMHYLTDFFCRVHNDINGITHPENFTHILYEQSFNRRLEDYELDVLREKVLTLEDGIIALIDKISLREYLKIKHSEYLKEAGRFHFIGGLEKNRIVDLKYSFEISLIVASYVIYKCNGKTSLSI